MKPDRRRGREFRCTGCGARFGNAFWALVHAFESAWSHWVLEDLTSECWQVFTGEKDITAI